VAVRWALKPVSENTSQPLSSRKSLLEHCQNRRRETDERRADLLVLTVSAALLDVFNYPN
jgi:hypothetical protein